MTITPDQQIVIDNSRGNDSLVPVTTAAYTVVITMNEIEPGEDGSHVGRMWEEIQRVMDDADFTGPLRYDTVAYDVVSREVIDVAPAGDAPKSLYCTACGTPDCITFDTRVNFPVDLQGNALHDDLDTGTDDGVYVCHNCFEEDTNFNVIAEAR